MKLLYYIVAIAAVVLIGRFWFLKNYFPVKDSVVVEKINDALPSILNVPCSWHRVLSFVAGFNAPRSRCLGSPENISGLSEVPFNEENFSPIQLPIPEPSVDSVDPVKNSDEISIEVSFTSQAPYEVWDAVHEEACEEASIIMVNVWVNGISSLSQGYAEAEIQKLVKWQKDNFGYFESTTAKQTADMAEKFYGLNYKLIENPSVEDLKNELKEENVIVMGVAGRELGNPHFTPPGPIYHMLLIKGFDDTGFITNDPGTKYGKDYHYSFSTLMSAARDWNGKKKGKIIKPPVAIVFSK
jgi:hypothetical protein